MYLNEGRLPYWKTKLILNRAIRLLPLYFFTLVFFWRFMVLFGGEGPLFFEYQNYGQCDSQWLWHLLFVNNLIPWNAIDGCMSWTWYIACEMQFFLLMPVLVENYYTNRKCFWVALGILWGTCSAISLIVITTNNISASYFTYDDDYWTVYYEKPWARMPAYLIGTAFGCSYYTYKHE